MTVTADYSERVAVPVPHKKGFPFIGILGEFFRETPLKVLHNASLEADGLIKVKAGPMDIHLVTMLAQTLVLILFLFSSHHVLANPFLRR